MTGGNRLDKAGGRARGQGHEKEPAARGLGFVVEEINAQNQAGTLLYSLLQRLDATQLPLPEPREFSADQLQQWMDEDEADMRRFQAGR